MHPIEHLRYIARAQGADPISVARETAIALGSLHAEPANLVIACRRIVERHPEAAPLWWLCSHLLTAEDPTELAWALTDQLDDDPAPGLIAAALPDEAVVLTIGWPATAGEALMRRGDVTVWCADAAHHASSFMRRLERFGVACDPVPIENLARAAALADIVMIDAAAASCERLLAPIGSHVLAAVARSVGTPVWLAVGLGRRLPVEYVKEIASRVIDAARSGDAVVDVVVDDLPLDLVTHVVSCDGVSELVGQALRPDCPCTPELLRRSLI